jgi:hypothetical protein
VTGQLVLVVIIGVRRVVNADGHDLVVDPLFVAHAHDANRPRFDDGQRIDRLLPEDEHVERVAIVAERPRNEP